MLLVQQLNMQELNTFQDWNICLFRWLNIDWGFFSPISCLIVVLNVSFLANWAFERRKQREISGQAMAVIFVKFKIQQWQHFHWCFLQVEDTGLDFIRRLLPGPELYSVNPLQTNLLLKYPNPKHDCFLSWQDLLFVLEMFWTFYCGNIVTNLFVLI